MSAEDSQKKQKKLTKSGDTRGRLEKQREDLGEKAEKTGTNKSPINFYLRGNDIMKDKVYDGEERRDHFRIKYPHVERPKLEILGENFDIIDISERGIKFYGGPKFQTTITFHDGEFFDIEGKVLRTQNNEMVVQLLQSIPFERIIKEQRYLVTKYVGYR